MPRYSRSLEPHYRVRSPTSDFIPLTCQSQQEKCRLVVVDLERFGGATAVQHKAEVYISSSSYVIENKIKERCFATYLRFPRSFLSRPGLSAVEWATTSSWTAAVKKPERRGRKEGTPQPLESPLSTSSEVSRSLWALDFSVSIWEINRVFWVDLLLLRWIFGVFMVLRLADGWVSLSGPYRRLLDRMRRIWSESRHFELWQNKMFDFIFA